MERLVTRIGNEPAVPTEFDMDFAFDLDKETFDKLQRIFNRLCDLTDILGDDYDLDRLKELVEADREGRCVAFPCKMGDTLYEVSDNRIDDYTVIGLSVGDKSLSHYEDDTDCIDNNLYILADRHDKGCRMRIDIWAIGDEGAVYTKREKAEAALEKMKEEDK